MTAKDATEVAEMRHLLTLRTGKSRVQAKLNAKQCKLCNSNPWAELRQRFRASEAYGDTRIKVRVFSIGAGLDLKEYEASRAIKFER